MDKEVYNLIYSNCKGWEKLAKEIAILCEAAIFQDDDVCIVIDGKEGAGKSFFLRKIGKFVKDLYNLWEVKIDFGIDNIHFLSQDYIDSSLDMKNKGIKGHVNILDESRSELSRMSSITKKSKRFVNYMSECRDANQVHLIALPAFHDLDKNIVLWRMRMLIHVQKKFVEDKKARTGFSLKRGDFVVYRGKQLFNAYFNTIRYTYPRDYEFSGNFTGEDPINSAEYENKKKEKRESKYTDQEKYGSQPEYKFSPNTQKQKIYTMVLKGYSSKQIIEKLKISKSYMASIRKQMFDQMDGIH